MRPGGESNRPERRRAATAALLVAALVLLGLIAVALVLWRARGGADGAGAPKINVVIVLIDTLRADRLGCYGYARATSPRIDALARESVLFEDASSAAPWTLPSVPSLLTSTLPCEHQILVDGNVLSPRQSTLAERLKRIGYATYSLYMNPYAGPSTGMNRGFDVSRLTTETGDTDGPRLDEFLKSRPPMPFFFYIHNTEPHNPYDVQDEFIAPFGAVSIDARRRIWKACDVYRRLTRADFDRKLPLGTTDNSREQIAALRALDDFKPQIDVLYDACVRAADTHVGSMIDTLKSRGLWENTLFIVTADHGEALGEHGGWQHDQSVYEELIHVPLIVRFPGDRHAGTRVQRGVGLIDVLPTVIDALGQPRPEGVRGRSLLPLIRGEAWRAADEPVVYSMRINRKKYFQPWKAARGEYNVVVRQGHWKLIYNVDTGGVELYDLAADPGEALDLSGRDTARVAKLRHTAEGFIRECASLAAEQGGGESSIDDASLRALENLGYVGGSQEDDDGRSGRPASRPHSPPGSSPASGPPR